MLGRCYGAVFDSRVEGSGTSRGFIPADRWLGNCAGGHSGRSAPPEDVRSIRVRSPVP